MRQIETLSGFANLLSKVQSTDRWILIGTDGEMGEGKSCFTDQLARKVSKLNNRSFTYLKNMTYSRKELKTLIDGDSKGKGRINPRSVILADELISMFFKRNWYDSEQIDGIELLNKCRDRHLCIIGNTPNFWDLDSAFIGIVTFFIHIHERGRAWVFQKDRNPFAQDKWHKRENEKIFRKKKNPYSCHGFVCEIHFPDWTPRQKTTYYKYRNTKRQRTEGQRARQERYKDIKIQRDELIRLSFTLNKKLTNKDLSQIVPSLTPEAIRLIRHRQR